MTAMSKTAALKAAQAACGSIIRRSGTDYVCYVPYYTTQIDGPSTEIQAYSYPRAVNARARVVAEIALHLMGQWRSEEYETDSLIEAASHAGHASAKAMLDYVLERQEVKS